MRNSIWTDWFFLAVSSALSMLAAIFITIWLSLTSGIDDFGFNVAGGVIMFVVFFVLQLADESLRRWFI